MSKRLTCFAAAGTIAALAIMAATPSTDLADAPNASHRFSLTLGTGSPVAFPFAQADFGSVDAPGLPTRSTLWAGSPAELPDVIVALGDEPISHALDRLGAAARGGDTRAALDAFRIADFCMTADLSRSALLALPPTADPAVLGRLRVSDNQNASVCRGATPAQLDERFANIRIAAEGGEIGAAAALLDAGLPGQASQRDGRDPAIRQWMDRTMAMVRRDADSGDLGALTTLASYYQAGDGVDADPVAALTYQIAAIERMKAQAQMYTPVEVALEKDYLDAYEAQVPREEIETARSAAHKLIESCCAGHN